MDHIKVLFTIMLFCFLSCKKAKDQNATVLVNPKDVSAINDNVDTNEEIWKRDSCGCLKLRTAYMADSIIVHNQLVGKDTVAFIEHMGKYNEKQKTQDGFAYIYYLGSYCVDNVVDEEADKSWMMFHFDHDGKLISIPRAVAVE